MRMYVMRIGTCAKCVRIQAYATTFFFAGEKVENTSCQEDDVMHPPRSGDGPRANKDTVAGYIVLLTNQQARS